VVRHGRPRPDLAATGENLAVGIGVCVAVEALWPALDHIAVAELPARELDARELLGEFLRFRAADAVHRDAVLVPAHLAARVRKDPFRADHVAAGGESGTLAGGLGRHGEVSGGGEACGYYEKHKRSFHDSRPVQFGSRGQECSAWFRVNRSSSGAPAGGK